MTPVRRIAHLDMDAFYASVELLRYPQLKGLPVVIGGRRRKEDDALGQGPLEQIPVDAFPRISGYAGRGVITTATYAARQFGVGSAMGIMKAAKLCPQAILLPVDFDEVRRFSRLFKRTITDIAPVMEDRGIDEVYIDLTEVPGSDTAHVFNRRGAEQAAGQARQRVRQTQRRHRGHAGRAAAAHLAPALPQGEWHRAPNRREAQILQPEHRR